jgi:hypothetical protein
MKAGFSSLFVGLALLSGVSRCTAQAATAPPPSVAVQSDTFTNPLLQSGPDPWVVRWKGFYYYSNSTGKDLTLRKTADITRLRDAQVKAVWAPEPGHPWSNELIG